MNFLESLVSEWYELCGYFVKTNLRTGLRPEGGWDGEIDVLAYSPKTMSLIHIETSSDAYSWSQRKDIFLKKFALSRVEYEKLVGTKINTIEKIAIVGWSSTKKDLNWSDDIKVKPIPKLLDEIKTRLKESPYKIQVVPESFPLLRAIQLAQSSKKE